MSVHHAREDNDEEKNQNPKTVRKQDHVTTNWDQFRPNVEKQNAARFIRAAQRADEQQRHAEIEKSRKAAANERLEKQRAREEREAYERNRAPQAYAALCVEIIAKFKKEAPMEEFIPMLRKIFTNQYFNGMKNSPLVLMPTFGGKVKNYVRHHPLLLYAAKYGHREAINYMISDLEFDAKVTTVFCAPPPDPEIDSSFDVPFDHEIMSHALFEHKRDRRDLTPFHEASIVDFATLNGHYSLMKHLSTNDGLRDLRDFYEKNWTKFSKWRTEISKEWNDFYRSVYKVDQLRDKVTREQQATRERVKEQERKRAEEQERKRAEEQGRKRAERKREEERREQETFRARAKANKSSAYAKLADKWKRACPGYRNGKSPTELKHDLRDLRVEENDEINSGTISRRFQKMMLETHPDKGNCPPNEALGILGDGEEAEEECVRLFNNAKTAKENMRARCFQV